MFWTTRRTREKWSRTHPDLNSATCLPFVAGIEGYIGASRRGAVWLDVSKEADMARISYDERTAAAFEVVRDLRPLG